jgi:hypothetical protein
MIGVAIGQREAYSHNFPAGKYRRQAEESRPAIVKSARYTALISFSSKQRSVAQEIELHMGAPVVGGWRKSGCPRVIVHDRAQSSWRGAVFVFLLLPTTLSHFALLLVGLSRAFKVLHEGYHLQERCDIDMNCNLAPVIFGGERRAELQCSVNLAGLYS